MFTELTYLDGRKVLIRAESVVLVEESKGSGCTIYFDEASGLDTVGVRELPSQVAAGLTEF